MLLVVDPQSPLFGEAAGEDRASHAHAASRHALNEATEKVAGVITGRV